MLSTVETLEHHSELYWMAEWLVTNAIFVNAVAQDLQKARI